MRSTRQGAALGLVWGPDYKNKQGRKIKRIFVRVAVEGLTFDSM